MFMAVIAPNSLLILITLGSAFVWAGTLIVLSLFLQGVTVAGARVWRFALALLVSVTAEEALRYGLWRCHRRAVLFLKHAAAQHPDLVFKAGDEALLALAAGFGHAMAHGLVFSLAWLPLASGQGVLYIKSCSTMSWAPAAAFTVLGFFGLHTGSMVVAFDALSRQKLHRAWAVGVVHLAAALLTLTNRAADACSLVATVELVLGTCMMAAAAFVFRTEMVAPVTYAPIAADDDGQ